MIDGFSNTDFDFDPIQRTPAKRSSERDGFFMQGFRDFYGIPVVRFLRPDVSPLEFPKQDSVFYHEIM